MATIFEVLQNANKFLKSKEPIVLMLAKDQINDAVTLLEKGYNLETEIEPLLKKYGNVDKVKCI